MRKLRNDKKIVCSGSSHKRILIRAGYFNIINGYKNPFVCGTDSNGNHIYISNTSVDQMYYLKQFDDELRSFLLRYITQVEEEVRTLTGYRFDKCNDDGKIAWYDTNAYNPKHSLQNKMNTISSAYSELSKSHLDYVKFYMENHKQIPTWIMLKVVNFSTFISVLQYSKTDVTHSICQLYGMSDINNLPNVKLLIGSLHWMRKVRNSCAHNERIYCLCRDRDKFHKNSGRIKEQYIYVQHIQEIHVKEYLILLCILNIICLMQNIKYLFRNYIICCPIFSSISNQMLLSTFVVKWEFEI